MKEFLRKITSISTLAGVVLAVSAIFTRGNTAAAVFLALFLSAWSVLRLYLWKKTDAHPAPRTAAGEPSRRICTGKAGKDSVRTVTSMPRAGGPDFEVPDIAESRPGEGNPQDLLLDSVNGHITDLLRSCYPGAGWEWLCPDPLSQIVHGGVARIRLLSVADYTYADISFADPRRLDIQLLRTDPLPRPETASASAGSAPAAATVSAAPAVPAVCPAEKRQDTDVQVWYSMIGQQALQQIITDLNVRGCRKLIIDESGAVYAAEAGKEAKKELTLDRMPAMRCWEDLKRILTRQELSASIEQDHLVIGW